MADWRREKWKIHVITQQRDAYISIINKYMVKSSSLLLWIHICIPHFYRFMKNTSCIILYLLHGDKSKDVDITFWHLFFLHDLLPIIPILPNLNIFNQYSLIKEKRTGPFQWYITHWVKSFPLLVGRALILCCRVMMQLSRDDNIVRNLEQFV